MKKKFICTVCGYVHEGDAAPEFCPQCKVPGSKFKEVVEGEGLTWADEHVIGVAKGVDAEVLQGLKDHFMGECTEVGMYLAMSRQADREGYPEIAEAYKRYAWEEAEHASKFAELIGEVVWDTKTNLMKRMNAESGACEDKMRLARMAKEEPCTIRYTRWPRTRRVTAQASRAFTTVTSRNRGRSAVSNRRLPVTAAGTFVPAAFRCRRHSSGWIRTSRAVSRSRIFSVPPRENRAECWKFGFFIYFCTNVCARLVMRFLPVS